MATANQIRPNTGADGSEVGPKAPPQTAAQSTPLAKATEQGFLGVEVDPTPNEHYTVAGVTAGKPTPETHKEAAEKVGSQKFAHVNE